MVFRFPLTVVQGVFGPILDDRLKEKSLRPWKGALSIHFRVCVSVCLSVSLCLCTRATDHSCWGRNLIFGQSDPWDIRKKRTFLFFEIFIFTLFIGIFRFFPYITLVNFWFQATGHSFSPGNMIFGLREPCIIRNWRLLLFFSLSDLFFNVWTHIKQNSVRIWDRTTMFLRQLQ